MAKLLNENNHLVQESKKSLITTKQEMLKMISLYKFKLLLPLIFTFLMIYIGIWDNSYLMLPAISSVMTFLWYLFIMRAYKKKESKVKEKYNKAIIKKAGADGEINSLKTLLELSDDYSIIQDLEIYDGEKKSQLDAVVIGRTGIFIIETKNLSGEIIGNEHDKNVTQIKRYKNKSNVTKNIYNPIKQVKTHHYRLSKLLRDNGFKYRIESIVYFCNPSAKVNLESNIVKVFSKSDYGDEEMKEFITEYERCRLSENNKKEIEELLLKYTRKKSI